MLATPLSCGRKEYSLSSVWLCLNFSGPFHPHALTALRSKDERHFHYGPRLTCQGAERSSRSGHSPRTRGGKAESIPSRTSFLVR